MEPSTSSTSGITIVSTEFEPRPGEKGIFDVPQRLADRVGTVSCDVLAKNLQSFCEEIDEAFDGVETTLSNYQLNSVEIAVQVSASGEVRMVGGVSAELMGALKLTFSRQDRPE